MVNRVFVSTLAVQFCVALAGNDWIDVSYLLSVSQNMDPALAAAKGTILQLAQSSAQGGPWSVTESKVLASSGDPKDYLSWAPYHWPDCNTCEWSTTGRATMIASAAASSASASTMKSASAIKSARSSSAISRPSASSSNDLLDRSYIPKKCYCTSKSKRGLAPSIDKSICVAPELALPVSATYTQCSYVARDGVVNPDVRRLQAGSFFGTSVISSLHNALAFALNGSGTYGATAAKQIYTMFLDPKLGVNPRLDYAQIVRGKGVTNGSFMGVLDFRSMVKLVNAVLILRKTGAKDWTQEYDQAMVGWSKAYLSWLSTSAQGVKASRAPNNHGTFYYNQVAALKILVGDQEGAKLSLQSFFGGAFMGQIQVDGTQPREIVRTRPFHYGCFNLEALITNAKLGTSLGLDFWSTRTNQNATIQTAANYLMEADPGSEDVNELLPHLAAVAAVYGDPDGKYKAFLSKQEQGYQGEEYWLFDQPAAFGKAVLGKRDLQMWERRAVLYNRWSV